MKRIIVWLFVVALLVGCAPEPDVTKKQFSYEIFYVEGMPCLRFSRVSMGGIWDYDGWTCDWSQRELERIVEPVAETSLSFYDVPTDHWAYEEIELIYSYGITVGCSYDPPLYCPDRPATRAEMAVFAARILEIIELGGE